MIITILSDSAEKRKEICKALGKETGQDDISFYSINYGGKIKTIIEPTLYPAKVQPLIYSIYAADLVVVAVDALNQFVGEMIVALEAAKKGRGILISSVPLPLKGTVLDKYEKYSSFEEAREKILNADVEASGESELFALVDKAFSVKSVGSVALGLMKEGSMKKHDKLLFFPGKKNVEVKSIQLNDKDVEECGESSRFGISYKGDEIERGQLLSFRAENKVESSVLGKFERSPFFKDDLNRKVHACLNFQFLECRVSDAELKCDTPLSYRSHDRIIVLDPSNQKLRVVGAFVAQ